MKLLEYCPIISPPVTAALLLDAVSHSLEQKEDH